MSLIIFALLTSICTSSNYTIWASNNTFSCKSATSNDICIFHCDVTTGYISFDCMNAGRCIIYCEKPECMLYSTLDAINSNNGGLVFDSTQGGDSCISSGIINLPSADDAILKSGDNSLGYTEINAGANTQNIYIDCSTTDGDLDCYSMTVNAQNAQNIYIDCHNPAGSNDCGGIIVNAQNANYLNINVEGGRLDGSPGLDVVIYCPQNSIYSGSEVSSCIIDASNGGYLEYVTFHTKHGIPHDLWIYADSDAYVDYIRIISDEPLCDQTQNVLFDSSSSCWNTKTPTNTITSGPTSIPITLPPTFTSPPSNFPSNIPSTTVTSSVPSLFPSEILPSTSKPSQTSSLSPTTKEPTANITNPPTMPYTNAPNDTSITEPTLTPTENTHSPTKTPTVSPIPVPTLQPTKYPTKIPTQYPSKYPTDNPTKLPTMCIDYDKAQSSSNGRDSISISTNITFPFEYENINETIMYYVPDENVSYVQCDHYRNNVSDICYIDCISEGSCSSLHITPHNVDAYLSALSIKCNSCDRVKINIANIDIDNVTFTKNTAIMINEEKQELSKFEKK
eukprot:255655_1